MRSKAIVLNANILIRAVLGKRVRLNVAYANACKYLPALLEKRGVKSAAAMTMG